MSELFPMPAPENARKLWVITLADLACLLLAFFALIFSMSSINYEKWKDLKVALSQRRILSDAPQTAQPTAQYNIATVFRKRAINLDYLHAVLHDTLAADPRFKTAGLELLEDRLVISLPGDILFASGSAALEGKAEQALFSLGGVLSHLTNPVAVVGHSDPTPPSDTFSSTWELTVGRAAAVANALKRTGYVRDVAVLGAGDAEYASLPPSRRTAQGRRVDIMILSGGG
jgi:chemotaxis protein MotB